MNLFIKPDTFFKDVISVLLKENFKETDILEIILVGSRLYRAHTEKSDYDVIVITKNLNGQSINKGIYNITCFTKDSFQESLNKQKMLCIEAFFAGISYKYKNIPFSFNLNKNILIENTRINTKATLERAIKNYSKKHIWHAIRINMFKEQLCNSGILHNFKEANWFLNECLYSYKSIDELIEEYKEYLK